MRTRICELPDPTEHPEGKRTKWKSQALRAYQRRMLAADALIASTYLAGTNSPIRAGCAVRSPPCLDRDDTGCARPRLTRLSSTLSSTLLLIYRHLGFFAAARDKGNVSSLWARSPRSMMWLAGTPRLAWIKRHRRVRVKSARRSSGRRAFISPHWCCWHMRSGRSSAATGRSRTASTR